jgi:hypothetical protein
MGEPLDPVADGGEQGIAVHPAPRLGQQLDDRIPDLPRIAWIVEYRVAELTDEERQIVRDATTRMLRAVEHDTN